MDLKKQKIYKKVFELACNDLLTSNRKEQQFTNAGVVYKKEQERYNIEIPYFDETITLKLPELSFKSSKDTNITLVTKIIILHYINTANGVLPGENRISYEDIPGLRGYLPVFEKRVIKPLLTAFGFNKHAFLETGVALGGIRDDYGDVSFTLHPLPRVPITFILWEGDEQFPSSLKILFDPSITGYFPLEDITVISKLASTRIAKKARLAYEV